MGHRKWLRQFPLHLHISTLFVVIILTLGSILSYWNYQKTSEIIYSANDKIFEHISDRITLKFREAYIPVAHTVNLLAQTSLSKASTLTQQSEYFPLLAEVLGNQPELTAIAAGFENGDYFIARALHDDYMKARFNAPDNSYIQIDQTHTGAGGRRLERIFFDKDLNKIGQPFYQKSSYDPRTRPWYKDVLNSQQIGVTAPYFYYFIQKVGITLSRQSADKNAVIAADMTLDMLSDIIANSGKAQQAEIVLLNDEDHVIAYKDHSLLTKLEADNKVKYASLDDLNNPIFSALHQAPLSLDRPLSILVDGRKWIGKTNPIALSDNLRFRLVIMMPEDQLLSGAIVARQQSLLITIIIILFTVPLIWLVARAISTPLTELANQTSAIRRFELTPQPEIKTRIAEVQDLGAAISMMRETITRFLGLLHNINAERDFTTLLDLVKKEMLIISNANAVSIHLLSDDESQLKPSCTDQNQQEISLPTITLNTETTLCHALMGQEIQHYRLSLNDSTDPHHSLLATLNCSNAEVYIIPLLNRLQESIGTLTFILPAGKSFTPDQQAFIQEFSSFASMTLATRQLVRMQKSLLESFVELIAQTIDAKSPYTGGHCQRVPALTKMLAQAAEQSNAPALKEFKMSTNMWETLHIASWMHDCGKVTTPDYVVDKATRLETIYNRIHEIRMRFEILKRDAEIEYWKAYPDSEDKPQLFANLQARWQQIDDDFAFVAQCNDGDQFMGKAELSRLNSIAAQTWERTLDDRLGLSWEEQNRMPKAIPPLPTKERLLADRAEHLILRDDTSTYSADNIWGFTLTPPEYLYNRGELYNLSIQRGTLTPEERFKINDHIVQTIKMLEALPYPRHLRNIPTYAGGHHEKMDGSGYPRGLHKEDMPLPSRIMAVADIFEALTAADRPYKKAKKLSEAVKIMAKMRDDNHIDADLFDLFLRSGTYKTYAQRYLSPEQIDEVDIFTYLQEEESTTDLA
ncbi:HD domain-containing phosphohydrolase [Neptuniibacter pectenicola]|jgi:HD-GYP domain-containing protein (c-di-GMP phosphodiesterase class II)/methyl-accepting chemotaxis protein|uniref:HD domain-containing phosphohydrolase n=1 Tax=Neptuniibacter pectenicola TaxID=1806669 RepID=UPI003F4BE272